MPRSSVAFIGIGNMGWPMAANLVKAGFEVTVCDARPGHAAKFVTEVGGNAAAGPAEAAKGVGLRRHHRPHQQAGGRVSRR